MSQNKCHEKHSFYRIAIEIAIATDVIDDDDDDFQPTEIVFNTLHKSNEVLVNRRKWHQLAD